MAKLTKRVIDGLRPGGSRHGTILWDSKLKGLGVRVFPTGLKTFVIKFRTRGGRQRWLKIGTFGALTIDQARERAKVELAKVLSGEDPADSRDQRRARVTISQLCDFYMEAAEAGLVLGRGGTAKKRTTIATDRGRIAVHIKPLLGQLKAGEIKRSDIEDFKVDVVTGKTARCLILGPRRRSVVRGGKGTFTRTIGLLGAIFAWGQEQGYVEHNPVRGVRRFASRPKKALLTPEQYRWLAQALNTLDARRDRSGERVHSSVGLAAIRFVALTGVRRGEAQNLRWNEVDKNGTCIALGETKTGPSLRPLSRAAFAIVTAQPAISDFVFPAGPDGKAYIGLRGLWGTVQRTAKKLAASAAIAVDEPPPPGPLDGVTPHSLRHSFAGIADELGITMPTIAALLGHRLGGVTGGYILKRVDRQLIDAANRVADHVVLLMLGNAPPSSIVRFQPLGRRIGAVSEAPVDFGSASGQHPHD